MNSLNNFWTASSSVTVFKENFSQKTFKNDEQEIQQLAKRFLAGLKFPFELKFNQFGQTVQEGTLVWMKKFQILADKKDTLLKIYDSNFGHFIGRVHPRSGLKVLQIIADWATMLFIYDDFVEKLKNADTMRDIHERTLSILGRPRTGSSDSPLMQGIVDLSKRINEVALKNWKRRFNKDVADYCEATIWELDNRTKGIIPSLKDYLEMRPKTSGTLQMFDFIEIAEKIYPPDEIIESDYIQSIRFAGANLVNWENDGLSAPKEMREGDVHNLVIVLQNERQYSYAEAFHETLEMYNKEVEKFENLKACMPDFGRHNEDVKTYVQGISDWISAHHFWAKDSTRYKDFFIKSAL